MRYNQNIAKNLAKTLNVSVSMLAGMLHVTKTNLNNCDALIDLNEFVQHAIKLGVKKELLINLLSEPINPEDEHSASILYHIIYANLTFSTDKVIQVFFDSTP